MKTVSSNDVNNLPVYDFSNDKPATEQYPEPKIAEKDILKAAMAAKSAKKPLVKSKLPSTKRGKAGRIVGISKGENELLQNLLSKIADDANYAMIVENEAFGKLQARYNK